MEGFDSVLTVVVLIALGWGLYHAFLSGERVGKVSFPRLAEAGHLGITVSRVPPGSAGEHRVRLRFGVVMGASVRDLTPGEAIELAEALERGAALVDRRAAP